MDNTTAFESLFCQNVEAHSDGDPVPRHVNGTLCQECAHSKGDDCEEEGCQTCCPHDERDHGICLDCEHEEDPGRAIDRAMDALEDR